MSLSIFAEKSALPSDGMLTVALSDTKTLWDAVKIHVEAVCGSIGKEW